MFSLNLSNLQDKQKINSEKYSQLAKYAQTADHSSQSKPGVSIYRQYYNLLNIPRFLFSSMKYLMCEKEIF